MLRILVNLREDRVYAQGFQQNNILLERRSQCPFRNISFRFYHC